MKAIILAGGLGTRLRNTVKNLPKPMAPINGKPFLEHQMNYWIKQGISHFSLSVGYLSETIIDYFGPCYKGIPIKYFVENKPLGTGGGMLSAAKEMKEEFLLLNGDTFIEIELKKLYNFHVNNSSLCTLSVFMASSNKRYMGIDMDVNGKIISLNSNEQKQDYYCNGGAYLFNPSLINKLDLFKKSKFSLEQEVLPFFLISGVELFGLECKGKFIDIGIPKDYLRASDVIK
jgi:D-glycero-alpha-D-manno-heptose 1-phosphate guanylyltransferase